MIKSKENQMILIKRVIETNTLLETTKGSTALCNNIIFWQC